MPVKDCQTEKLILDTAMRVYFKEGRMYATTQEIADAAGVNRTLINYYFRSKKELLKALLTKAHREFTGNSDEILLSSLPFREKTEAFIGDFMDRMIRYPYLEPFITLNILNERFSKTKTNIHHPKPPASVKHYLHEIENEMIAGRLPKRNPTHFMLNLLSLVVYPFLTKPIQSRLLDLDEAEFDIILDERKKIVMDTLFPEKVG